MEADNANNTRRVNRLGADTIIAGLAFIVALASLYATYQQNEEMKKHNRLSVVPHLTLRWHLDHELHSYRLEVWNTGIGPAKVSEYKLLLDGEELAIQREGGWLQLLEQLPVIASTGSANVDWFEVGDGLRPGASRVLFEFSIPEEIGDKIMQSLLQGSDLDLAGTGKTQSKLSSEMRAGFFKEALEELERAKVNISYESFYGERQPSIEFTLPFSDAAAKNIYNSVPSQQ